MRGIILLLALVLFAAPAQATIINVNSTDDEAGTDGDCTLRDAIRAANRNVVVDGCPAGQASPQVDTINVPSGTYTHVLTGTEVFSDPAAVGDLDLTEHVILQGAGRDTTIIDAARLDRVIQIAPLQSVNVTIRNLTLRNGCPNGGSCQSGGGGLEMNNGGTVYLENLIVEGSQAFAGGGVHAYAPPQFSLSTFISDSVLRNNTATAIGGGISSHNDTTMTRVTVTNNRAINGAYGAGIGVPQHTLILINSTVSDNTATGNGGGITVQGYNAAPFTGSGALVAVNSTISGNRAEFSGGGIFVNDGAGSATVACTVARCSVALYNVTITGNHADSDLAQNPSGPANGSGGGILLNTGANAPLFTMYNSIIAGNSDFSAPSGLRPDCSGAVTSGNYNLIGDSTGCTIDPQSGDRIGTSLSPIDPLLGPLADNGGPAFTHAALAGSPALDTGNPAGCLNHLGSALSADQRGLARPSGAACDMGSYEFQLVTVCGNGNVEFGEQCDDGNASSGDCCSATCQFEANGASCNDGNSCTAVDVCNGAGSCAGSGSPCGDGVLNANCGEQCDDGGTASGDCCDSACRFEAFGSSCSDGNTCTATDACDGAGLCAGSGSTCGNGSVDGACGEQCDDGNSNNGDGCSAACQAEFCGDGSVNDRGLEQCDDGNTDAGDGCGATCQLECGNGVMDAGEACDDGNRVSGDCCSSSCRFETAGSACNDGNACSPADACNGAGICTGSGSTCGNGSLEGACGEQCDDGNSANGDGCNGVCGLESCGDGSVNNNGAEACDDGNTTAGDGCGATCQLEPQAPPQPPAPPAPPAPSGGNPPDDDFMDNDFESAELPDAGPADGAENPQETSESEASSGGSAFRGRFIGSSCAFSLAPGAKSSLSTFWALLGVLAAARARLRAR